MERKATAKWEGTGLEGTGHLSTQSKVFVDQPYSFQTRFKNEDGSLGTNPEELIAAAHAGCFTMALSFQLGGAGFTPTALNTKAVLKSQKVDGHFEITGIVLNLEADVPGIGAEEFGKIAQNAKNTCPVSKALSSIEIVLNAKLV